MQANIYLVFLNKLHIVFTKDRATCLVVQMASRLIAMGRCLPMCPIAQTSTGLSLHACSMFTWYEEHRKEMEVDTLCFMNNRETL